MRNLKLLLPLLVLFTLPTMAQDYHYEIGYTTVSAEGTDGSDLDLGGIYGLFGYDWNVSGALAHSFEAAVAFGVQDESLPLDASINLQPTLEAAYRGTWQTKIPDFSFYGRLSYARVELEIEALDISESADESGFGAGLGVTWRGITLGYTQYFGDLEDFSRINIGYRF